MTALSYSGAIALVPLRVQQQFSADVQKLDLTHWGVMLPLMQTIPSFELDGTGWVLDADGRLWRVISVNTARPVAYRVLGAAPALEPPT